MIGMRTVVWILVGIAIAVSAHFLIDLRTSAAPKGLRRNTLAPSAEKAAVLSVARRGEPGVRLVRDESWKIVSPYPASAEQSAVLRLTDALSFSPISDELTDAELLRIGRTRRDFGLDSPRVVVTAGNSSGEGVEVSFGADTPSGDGVYATVLGQASVYVVSSNVFAAANLDVAGFRCRRLLSARQEDVVSFDIKNGAGRFVRIVRDGETWKMSEPYEMLASSSKARSFLDALVGMEARDFVWPVGVSNEATVASVSLLAGYGLDPDSAFVVTLKCADGKDGSVSFGRAAGKDEVYALVRGGTAIVTVPLSACESARADAGAFVDARAFPVEAASVGAISVDDGGTAYMLSRNAEGVWRLDAPVSALADQEAVEGLVRRLLALKYSDVAADGVLVSVGTNAEPVSVSRPSVFAGMRPEDLRSKTLAKLDPKQVKRVVVTGEGKASVSAVFDGERKSWALEGSESVAMADGEALSHLVAALNPLEAVRVVRLKVSEGELGVYGLDKPFRTIAIDQTAAESVRRNILIGDVTDGGRYATLGASDAVFVISSDSAAALLAPIAK